MKRTKSIITSLLLAATMIIPVNVMATSSTSNGNGSNSVNSSDASNASATSNTSNTVDGEKIVLVSINDFHGNLEEDPKGKNPGIAKVAGVINELKEKYGEDQVHFYSSGDVYQGTAISNLTKGDSVNAILKTMKIEASALGNHEYDWGVKHITRWSEEAGFPFVASNIVYKDSKKPVEYAKPYIVKEYALKNGKTVKVGIVGIATPETATKTLVENVKDIEFTDPAEAATQWVKHLKEVEKVDAVVALTHLGLMVDKETKEVTGEAIEFAKKVEGIDILFTGHTHATAATMVGKTMVLQGYYNGRTLSVGELIFDKDGKFLASSGYTDEIYKRKDEIKPDDQVLKMVETFKKELSPILDEKLGENMQDLLHGPEGDRQVTELGQWSAKTLAELGKTQIGYINGGGIRTDLNKGEINMGMMYSIFPFDNTLYTMEVTGKQLKEILQHGLYPKDFRPGQFYGVNVYFNADSKEITKVTLLDGTEVTDEGTYTLATLDFLATGGDGYKMMKEAKNQVDTFKPVRDLLVDVIKNAKKIEFKFEQNLFPEGAGSSNTSNTSK